MTPDTFDVSIRWRPFELNPQMSGQGQSWRQHIAQKYGEGGRGQGSTEWARLIELGETLGFSFGYREDMRIFNTFRAHQLLHWACQQERQTALMLALFTAFFTHHKDISNIDILVDTATEVGLNPSEARAVLVNAHYATSVREQEAAWLNGDIQGVPYFLFNDHYPVQGAADAERFIRLLQKISRSCVSGVAGEG